MSCAARQVRQRNCNGGHQGNHSRANSEAQPGDLWRSRKLPESRIDLKSGPPADPFARRSASDRVALSGWRNSDVGRLQAKGVCSLSQLRLSCPPEPKAAIRIRHRNMPFQIMEKRPWGSVKGLATDSDDAENQPASAGGKYRRLKARRRPHHNRRLVSSPALTLAISVSGAAPYAAQRGQRKVKDAHQAFRCMPVFPLRPDPSASANSLPAPFHRPLSSATLLCALRSFSQQGKHAAFLSPVL